MNKHGFKGVRMRTDGRAMPFYARATVKGEYIYLPSRETAEDAAKDFETFRRTLAVPSHHSQAEAEGRK